MKNDSLKRDDIKTPGTEPQFGDLTQKALNRAAARGTANLTDDMVEEIGRDWVMVRGRQIAVQGTRAFRL